jgi:hypothetical protein
VFAGVTAGVEFEQLEGFMKQLRSAAFLSLIVFLIVLLSPSSSGQSTQPSQTPNVSPSSPEQSEVAPIPDRARAALQPPATNSNNATSGQRPKIRFLQRVQPRKSPKMLPDPPLVPGVSGQRVADSFDGALPGQPFRQSPDPGIVLNRGTGNVCGSIVSYNFTPGDNPQLESVTTCTPADAVATRRAQGRGKKPSAPLFQTTEYSTPQH